MNHLTAAEAIPMAKPSILVTGSNGHIARKILPYLRDDFQLRLADIGPESVGAPELSDYLSIDLADRTAISQSGIFDEIDSVVHLGFQRLSEEEDDALEAHSMLRLEVELSNIRMAANIYDSALRAGVRRIVMASSNHAADWYERELIPAGVQGTIRPDDPPLSDNYYGWSKAAYELLGFPYACGTFGRKLEVILLRIGAPRDVGARNYFRSDCDIESEQSFDNATFTRDLGAYISDRDLGALFSRSLLATDVKNEHGVPWVVAYGISDNTRAFWSLASARKRLGYQPKDDSEIVYSEDIRRFIVEPALAKD